MNRSKNEPRDHSEDYFADTRMSFGDHIEELRIHLWRAIVGFMICLFIGFFIDGISYGLSMPWYIGMGKPALIVIAKPVEDQLNSFQARKAKKIGKNLEDHDEEMDRINQDQQIEMQFELGELARRLGLPPPASDRVGEDGEIWAPIKVRFPPLELAIKASEANRLLIRPAALSTLSAQETFMVYFKVSLLCGFILASPWVFFQIWSFIAAGLYPHEKRYVNVYLPFSLGLFLSGAAVCQFLVLPKAIEALLWFNEWLGFEPDLRLNEWLGFAIVMPLVFGVSFQTPLVMLFLDKIGIMRVETFQSSRKIAWMALAVFAAVITPSVDSISMLFLWVPLCGLYELGIILCRMSPRQEYDFDAPDPEELVEV